MGPPPGFAFQFSFLCLLLKGGPAALDKNKPRTEHSGRDHPLSTFVVGIGPLGHVDGLANLCLGQVGIFPEVPYPSVSLHTITKNSIVRTICSIYILNILF